MRPGCLLSCSEEIEVIGAGHFVVPNQVMIHMQNEEKRDTQRSDIRTRNFNLQTPGLLL